MKLYADQLHVCYAYSLSTGTMIARAASVLSDGIVLILTLMKTYLGASSSAERLESSPTVRGALLKDSEYLFYSCLPIELMIPCPASICFS